MTSLRGGRRGTKIRGSITTEVVVVLASTVTSHCKCKDLANFRVNVICSKICSTWSQGMSSLGRSRT
eukprot:3675408-Amphidinium_carterae.1